MFTHRVEGDHLTSGGWLQRLHLNIHPVVPEVCLGLELLALAPGKGQGVRKARILRLAEGAAPPPVDVLGLNE